MFSLARLACKPFCTQASYFFFNKKILNDLKFIFTERFNGKF